LSAKSAVPALEAEVAEARAAQMAGRLDEAERLVVPLIERSPMNVVALALLADIRATQGKTSAATRS